METVSRGMGRVEQQINKARWDMTIKQSSKIAVMVLMSVFLVAVAQAQNATQKAPPTPVQSTAQGTEKSVPSTAVQAPTGNPPSTATQSPAQNPPQTAVQGAAQIPAQSVAPGGPPGTGDRVERRVMMLKDKLNLSDDQVTKVRTILQDEQKQAMSDREKPKGDRETMRKAMMDRRKATDDKIMTVLTADQKKEYSKTEDEFRKQMQQRREQGGKPAAPGGKQGP
jgi:Spy/CpxP family protein refolding chaperone